jgi:rhodanese-related sulfurtransferase
MKARVKRIGPAELQDLRAQNENITLIDVREPFEQATFGVIPGVENIPLGELPSRLGELPEDPAAPIVMICQSGVRSLGAAEMLTGRGYTNVYSLDGGTGVWLRAYR